MLCFFNFKAFTGNRPNVSSLTSAFSPLVKGEKQFDRPFSHLNSCLECILLVVAVQKSLQRSRRMLAKSVVALATTLLLLLLNLMLK